MDIVRILGFLPYHLKQQIILKIHPKYIAQFRNFYKIDSKTDQEYENRWYLKTDFKYKDEYLWKSLVRALELEYYELFNKLFNKYMDIYPLPQLRLDQLLATSSYIGNQDYIDRFLNMDANNYEKAMIEAARGGYLDIAKRMKVFSNVGTNSPSVDKPISQQEYNKAMIIGAIEAARRGELELIKKMTPGDNLGDMLLYGIIKAGKEGNLENFQKLFKWAKDNNLNLNYHPILGSAAEGGNPEIVKKSLDLVKSRPKTPLTLTNKLNYSIPAIGAAKGGNLKIFEQFFPLVQMDFSGLTDYEEMLVMAAEGGNLEIFNQVLEFVVEAYNHPKNAISDYQIKEAYNNALVAAATKGNLKIIDKMLNFMENSDIPIQYHLIREGAVKGCQDDIYQYLIDLMERKNERMILKDYLTDLSIAIKYGDYDFVKMLLDKVDEIGVNKTYMTIYTFGRLLESSLAQNQIEIFELLLDRLMKNGIKISDFDLEYNPLLDSNLAKTLISKIKR